MSGTRFGMRCGVVLLSVLAVGLGTVKGQVESSERSPVPNLSLAEAIDAVQSLDPEVRFDGALVLESLGPKAAPAVGPIVQILEKHDPADYLELLHVLIAIGPEAKAAAPVLVRGLESENFHVRYLSCRVLGNTGMAAKPAVKKLIQLAGEPITSVRRRAVEALGNLGHGVAPQAVPTLIHAAEEPGYVVKVEAVLALGKFGDQAKLALPILQRIAKNPKAAERAQAAWAIYAVTGKTDLTLTVLAEELNQIDHPWEAAAQLVRMAPKVPNAVGVLATGLQNPDPSVRQVAAEYLGNTGALGKSFLPNLKGVLADADTDVQDAARQAIEKIQKASVDKKTEK